MTDKKDETGKGPARPGDGASAPLCDARSAGDRGRRQGQDRTRHGGRRPKPDARRRRPCRRRRISGDAGRSAFADEPGRRAELVAPAATQSNAFLSHVAAGVAGAVLTLVAAALFGLFPARHGEASSRRTSTSGSRPWSRRTRQRRDCRAAMSPPSSPRGYPAQGPGGSDARHRRPERTQAKLAANIKALEARSASPEYVNRARQARDGARGALGRRQVRHTGRGAGRQAGRA